MTGMQKQVFACRNSSFVFHFFIILSPFRAKLVSLHGKLDKYMTQTEQLYALFVAHPVVTTDSRDCPEGSIFFALKGETFDGNQYARAALEAGCSFAVVDNPEYAEEGNPHLVLVDDCLTALQDLARYHRRKLGIPVIGITGTNGKTTTKELTAAVLAKKYNVLYTQGNFNNHIGVPKTLLRLNHQHQVAVIEMGANHLGEIKTLVNIVEPDYGLITTVGTAHLQGFGSFEGVLHTKGELYDYLRLHDGHAFVDETNEHLMGIAPGLQMIPYGNEGTVESCDPYMNINYEGRIIHTQLIGDYNKINVLAALAVGQHFGVEIDDMIDALEAYTPSMGRSQLVQTEHNTLIVDAYNANPMSMKAALDNFRHLDLKNKMVILGDMGELGEESRKLHGKVLQKVYECAFPMAWLVGKEFREAAKDLPDYSANILFFADVDEVKAALAASPIEGRTILIKASNSMKLHTLPEVL